MNRLATEICRALADRNVRTVFGIPGVHNLELYRGLADSGISHILARHEQGAGFMADGYARASRKPGVAFVISGPGVTNILTPVGQAYSDSVPMLVLATCLDRADILQGDGKLHELKNQEGAGDSVADWSLAAGDAQSVYRLMDRAFNEFSCKRARPKIINVPLSILSDVAPPPPVPARHPAKPRANPEIVEQAANLIRVARRPLFVFGGGAVGHHASARKLVEAAGGAVFMTYAGRGIVSPDYPFSFGSFLARPESARCIADADLVVAVGTMLSQTDLWRDRLGHKCRMVRVDIDPGAFAALECEDIPVLGDAGDFFASVLELLEGCDSKSGWNAADVAGWKSVLRNSCASVRPGVAEVAAEMADGLLPGTQVFSDMTQLAYAAKEIIELDAPGSWHHPYGFGTLGYALPAAIGGKVAKPDSPVLSIAGDYGFQYTMQELGTLADIDLPVVVLLWDNGGLKEIELSMEQSQIEPTATRAFIPNLHLLARSYGLGYVKQSSLSDLAPTVEAALKSKTSILIHADAAALTGSNR